MCSPQNFSNCHYEGHDPPRHCEEARIFVAAEEARLPMFLLGGQAISTLNSFASGWLGVLCSWAPPPGVDPPTRRGTPSSRSQNC